jgi:hypothetical protein
MTACDEHGGIERILEQWLHDGLIVKDGGRVLALAVNATAVNATEASAREQRRPTSLPAPVAYLDSGPADPRRLPVVS